MATADSVKSKINALISKANDKTGKTDSTLTAAVDRLITGYGQGSGTGITPTGTIKITENGDYDVTSYANAEVDVPESVESTGNVEADNLAELHYWEKYVSGSDQIVETEVTDVTMSLYTSASNPWDAVDYADAIEIVNGELQLINPTNIILNNTTKDQVVGKYVLTSVDKVFYKIPSDAKMKFNSGGVTNIQGIVASKAYKLTAILSGSLLGVVVSANSTAYPEDGEQDGYRYVYMGTLESTGGGDGTLPTLTNPGSATDMAEGKELIDGSGKIVTGTLFEVPAGNTLYGNNNPSLSWRDDGKVETVSTYGVASSGDGGIIRPGAKFAIRTPAEQYGNATAADVAAGKTFTSAAGLMLTGTSTGAGGSGLVMMTGKTVANSNVIDTGLSDISIFILQRLAVSSVGLVNAVYQKDTGYTGGVYCFDYGTYTKSFSTFRNTNGAVEGGIFTWNGSDGQELVSNNTYDWIAVGTA